MIYYTYSGFSVKSTVRCAIIDIKNSYASTRTCQYYTLILFPLINIKTTLYEVSQFSGHDRVFRQLDQGNREENQSDTLTEGYGDQHCFENFLDALTNDSEYCTVILYILEEEMTIQTTYTQARNGLAKLLNQVTHNREVVVIQRRGEEEVAMIAASELESLMETAYLLRSPANAERLISALGRALKNEIQPLAVEDLRREVGLE